MSNTEIREANLPPPPKQFLTKIIEKNFMKPKPKDDRPKLLQEMNIDLETFFDKKKDLRDILTKDIILDHLFKNKKTDIRELLNSSIDLNHLFGTQDIRELLNSSIDLNHLFGAEDLRKLLSSNLNIDHLFSSKDIREVDVSPSGFVI